MPKLGKCVSQFVEDSSTIYLKIDWHSVFLQTGASFSRQPYCKSLAEGTVCLQYNHEIMKIYFFAVGDSGSFIRLFVALLQIGKMGLKPSPQQPTQRYYLQLLSSCKESLGKWYLTMHCNLPTSLRLSATHRSTLTGMNMCNRVASQMQWIVRCDHTGDSLQLTANVRMIEDQKTRPATVLCLGNSSKKEKKPAKYFWCA